MDGICGKEIYNELPAPGDGWALSWLAEEIYINLCGLMPLEGWYE
jgi:hypothetical protein